MDIAIAVQEPCAIVLVNGVLDPDAEALPVLVIEVALVLISVIVVDPKGPKLQVNIDVADPLYVPIGTVLDVKLVV